MTDRKIRQLVLDAGPLITETVGSLQKYAEEYFTTPGVYGELKDEQVRNKLLLWNDSLKVRHPKPESIKKVEHFAKLTGDYSVLSLNDIHIIALAYELEVEQNGTWRLRSYPGEKVDFSRGKNTQSQKAPEDTKEAEEPKKESNQPEVVKEETAETKAPDGKKKPRRRGGKKQREKREARLQADLDEMGHEEEFEVVSYKSKPQGQKQEQKQEQEELTEELTEEFDEDDDDGEWITPENLQEELLKDNNEEVQETKTSPLIKVALSTGDFACQNVAMQMGLSLMNAMSGKQIKRIRNYMYRCHACFRLTPMPKSGKPKHFCPNCGGNTLLRCAVSIDNVTGKVTPHLKANFQWINRGNKFSLPSPQSKNQQKRQGNGGYQHNRENRHKSLQNPLLLNEDDKEYQKAIKNDEWQRKQNDKLLQEWIGGGSADNYISPFNSIQNMKPSGVRVGSGRYVNASRKKK